jgi:hypothetical protein
MIGPAVASSTSCSSPNPLWQMMNFMQYLTFIVLFGVYLPALIKDMISSSSFFAFFPNSSPTKFIWNQVFSRFY